MGQSVLSRGRSLLGGDTQYSYCCPTAKGNRVNIPEQGHGEWRFRASVRQRKRPERRLRVSREELSFLCKAFSIRGNDLIRDTVDGPQSTAPLAVSGAHPWALENLSEVQ